jgi:uncharacterized protein (TIGR03663 family)
MSTTTTTESGALADFPMLRAKIDNYKTTLAEMDWTPWLIVGLGALLRILFLGIKPPHFDEGINGWFVDAHIVKQGFYRYDPTNYHGPLHFYVLFLFKCLFGRNIWALRMPVVIVSTISIWLALKFEPFVSRNVARLAALAMAVSPGFVFYGRYSIHEAWLLMFSMLFVFGLFGLWRVGTVNYLWCVGMGAAGMILTKETYIIHIACALIAIPVLKISAKLNPLPDAKWVKQKWDYVDLAVVTFVGVALIVFFYSGTFFHWNGVKDIFMAFKPWFETGSEGHGHDKPWYYWLKLIAQYEWPVLLGLVACGLCQQLKNFSLRYLAIYGVGTLAVYSYVHYKTPWCIISIVWPFLFLFGVIPSFVPNKRLADLALSAVLVSSLISSIRLNYFRCTTDTEPYVYVQTYNDVWKLTEPLLTLAKRNPVNYHLTGHLVRQSSYPLPWMLGDFPNIGYYEHENLPGKVDADFLLVQEDKIDKVEAKLNESYFTEPLRIRAYQDTSKVYFNAKRFAEFFPNRQPDFVGGHSTHD